MKETSHYYLFIYLLIPVVAWHFLKEILKTVTKLKGSEASRVLKSVFQS